MKRVLRVWCAGSDIVSATVFCARRPCPIRLSSWPRQMWGIQRMAMKEGSWKPGVLLLFLMNGTARRIGCHSILGGRSSAPSVGRRSICAFMPVEVPNGDGMESRKLGIENCFGADWSPGTPFSRLVLCSRAVGCGLWALGRTSKTCMCLHSVEAAERPLVGTYLHDLA